MVRETDATVAVEMLQFKSMMHDGVTLITEDDAKSVMGRLGVSIPNSTPIKITENFPDELETGISYPLVLKGVAPNVVHKTDLGLVSKKITSSSELIPAYRELELKLRNFPGARIIAEDFVSGDVELIVSYMDDPAFGPLIMCGIGGTSVEILRDVVWLTVPFTEDEVVTALGRLQMSNLLREFRGRKSLVQPIVSFLLKMNEIAMRLYEEGIVNEIEMNPVCISSGMATIVDCKIRLMNARERGNITHYETPDMERLFKPKTIAVVGASPGKKSFATLFVENCLDSGYTGEIYPVNPRRTGETIRDRTIYGSLSEIPGGIDYAFIAVPAKDVVELLEQNRNKIRFAHVITSGFGELDTSGRQIEQQILKSCSETGTRVIGPNCLGVYSSEGGLTLIDGVPSGSGEISLCSQSGGLTADLLRAGSANGLKFSKAISIGNSIDLGPEDFLEYFSKDPESKTIGMYIEQVKDGHRFISTLRNTIRMGKNVVILKGGKNAQGSQAAASHTGALKQDYEVFYHLCMQCGATMVGSLHDFIVGLKSFQYGRKTKNRNLLMIGPSGGATVLAADQCGVFGINLTEIPEDERNVLMSLGVPPGSTLRNPVDLPVGALAHENGMLVKHVCEAAYKNNTYEFTLIHLNIQNIQSYTLDPELILSNICRTAIEVANTHRKETQVFVSLRMNSESRVDEMCRTYAKFLQSHGIATFWAIDDALSAIRFLTCGNSAM